MSTLVRVVVAVLLLFASTAEGQDALGSARDLYASAAYEEALAALGKLKAEASAPATSMEIDRYRVLCLMALGRAAEADKIIESIVINDPLYQPAVADTAPRVRAAFTAARQRVLPGVARNLYIEAKAAFDRKSYPDAVQGLEKVVRVIDNLETADRAELNDLRMLASGFLELSRSSLAASPLAAKTSSEAKTEPAVPAEKLPPSTPLVALDQTLPPMPFSMASSGTREFRGRIEVEIDDAGRVSNVRLLQSVHVLYDPLLLKAAREWKYEPPRSAGKPMASIKRVEIVLKP